MAEVLTPSFLVVPTIEAAQLDRWSAKASLSLWESLAPLPDLSSLDQDKPPIHSRIGWHEGGLAVGVEVRGKTLAPKSEPLRQDGDDQVVLGIDTRDTKSIHRAGKFCHRFHLTPCDELGDLDPSLASALIPRATQDAPLASFTDAAIAGELLDDGYRLVAVIRSDALNGFDPTFSDRIGLHLEVRDRELGSVPLWGDPKLPGSADPSLWGSVRLMPSV